MASHLYIIGNGFDKHHDIPSGYQDYRHWLEEKDYWNILDIIDDIFGCTNDDWWKHFEDNLASAETLNIAYEEAFQNYPDFGSDYFRDSDWYDAELSVERKMNNAYEEILDSFYEWVIHLPHGNINKRLMIPKDKSVFIFNFVDKESLFGFKAAFFIINFLTLSATVCPLFFDLSKIILLFSKLSFEISILFGLYDIFDIF